MYHNELEMREIKNNYIEFNFNLQHVNLASRPHLKWAVLKALTFPFSLKN